MAVDTEKRRERMTPDGSGERRSVTEDDLWEGFFEKPVDPSTRAVLGPHVRVESETVGDAWVGDLKAREDFSVPERPMLPFEPVAIDEPEPRAPVREEAPATSAAWPGAVGGDEFTGVDNEPYFSVPVGDASFVAEPDPTAELPLPYVEAEAIGSESDAEPAPVARAHRLAYVAWLCVAFGFGALFARYALPTILELLP